MSIAKLNRPQNKTKRRVWENNWWCWVDRDAREGKKRNMERENSQNTIYTYLKVSNNKIIIDKNVEKNYQLRNSSHTYKSKTKISKEYLEDQRKTDLAEFLKLGSAVV